MLYLSCLSLNSWRIPKLTSLEAFNRYKHLLIADNRYGERMNLLDNHYEEVIKPTWNYAKRIHTANDDWSNAALGLAGEAGETVDTIKKMLYHTADKDYTEALKKELGDVIYYWNKVRMLAGFTVKEILEANKEKLSSRHPELGQVQERWGEGAIL